MYSTCLFCNSDLGRNDVIETFPVGRRLAFDAAKGRLWVVCRRCERWNLTPLEERWEAIESCTRAFGGTRMRISTDEIGLAKLKEGLELVRIGAPQRPEMAAWRYGDQFGRRRRKHYTMVAGGAVVIGAIAVAGPALGLIGAGAINPTIQLFNAGRRLYGARTLIRVPGPGDTTLMTRLADLSKVRLTAAGEEFVLEVPVALRGKHVPWWRYDRARETHELRGDAAIRAAAALLPRLNRGGGSKEDVQRAVESLEAAETPDRLFRRASEMVRSESRFGRSKKAHTLIGLPNPSRLALEMASHEESERRALEGELHLLEAAWRDAEEIAQISDDMFLPESIDEDLARLKRQRDSAPGASDASDER